MKYDVEEISCLRQKISRLKKNLSLEYDPNEKKKIEMKIKILELKIMIAKIN